MIYLMGQVFGWLLLTAAFAALAGWAFAAERAAPAEAALRRDRDNILRDLARLASGESGAQGDDEARAADALRSRADIREGRIAELEHALEQARARADSAVAEAADLQRRLERNSVDAAELARLRNDQPAPRPAVMDAEIEEPQPDEDIALQGWRLRYFEQRVRYLEDNARAAAAALAPPPSNVDPLPDWRAREAEARAAHLEDEVRRLAAPASPEPDFVASEPASPFAANPDVDVLLRWRLLYLERRVAHLANRAAALAAPPSPEPEPALTDASDDPDRWRWRARYLEARVRHLEQRPFAAPQGLAADDARETPTQPARRGSKPAVLASARNGAPDDLTLIEGVSLQQQSTFYALGVYHYDQIAAWTADNVAWVDQYLRLRGRVEDEEWVEQADVLAREGPAAARRGVVEDA